MLWCVVKDSVALRGNVSVIYGPGVISGERPCSWSDCYGSELWLSLVRVSHGQALVLPSTLLNTVLPHCLVTEHRRFVTTSTVPSTLTQCLSCYFIFFPSWQPISPITNWNVFPSLQPISLAPIEISIHIYSLFSYYQLKFLSFFTTYFPITNWNVFPSLQPISLSPIEMSFHLYNLFPYYQLKCLSIFTTYFPIASWNVLPSLKPVPLWPFSSSFHPSTPYFPTTNFIVVLPHPYLPLKQSLCKGVFREYSVRLYYPTVKITGLQCLVS